MELNIEQIKEILPHRYPFLLIDKVTDYVPGEWAEAVKCVTANEPFFQGHFPQKAIMPGVLIMEALAQTGAVAILSEEENKGKIAVFGGIKNCRFRRQVVPGDVITLRCELVNRRGPIGYGKATAMVEGEIAATGELSFVVTE
ncbi:MAG: 3-hydroxyacyl-ACP dehydratase FabZ [Eubacteriaceae bacterium]|nr:3-hydroxyacyl-ACP dehydratase FabZ [Eubacteriaceae bacterium]